LTGWIPSAENGFRSYDLLDREVKLITAFVGSAGRLFSFEKDSQAIYGISWENAGSIKVRHAVRSETKLATTEFT